MSSSPSEQFNTMAGEALNKLHDGAHQDEEKMSLHEQFRLMAEETSKAPLLSIHPDEEGIPTELMEQIEAVGGMHEVWKPVTYGRVVKVENYDFSDEVIRKEFNPPDIAAFRQKYNVYATRSQKVIWIDGKGFHHVFGWDDKKSEHSDVDHNDFPNGYAENDYIKVTCRGAIIESIHRVTLEEVQANQT